MKLDQLSSFVGSEARARLLAHFVARPESRLHMRALERDTGIGKRSLQKELDRLVAMGLVRREHEGRRVVYVRAGYTPEWRAMEMVVAAYGLPLLLRAALVGVPGVEAAFIFGSLARGDARPDSDIDLLVYGNAIPDQEFGATLLDLGVVLEGRLDVKDYDHARFEHDNDPRVSFLPTVLTGPKVWLIGSEANLPAIRLRRAA